MSAGTTEHIFLINEESFTLLFNKFWKKVYAVCLNNINSPEDAKELTQNIFKSLWERRDNLRISGSIENYIMRSAKLQVINYYRYSKSEATHQNCFYQSYCDFEHCTENQVLFKELNNHVNLLVDQLPCQCKLVYQLKHDKHLANKEIAVALNISIKTVEYHLSNAGKLLKNSLQEFV